MKHQVLCKHARLGVAICVLVGVAVFGTLVLSGHATAQPTTFFSPVGPQQGVSFLSVPYYGAEGLTAYFDHEFPDGLRNGRVVLYDGRVGRTENGACGWNSQGQAIAYWSQPGGQGQCLWYEGHQGNDFPLSYEPVIASANGTVIRAGWQDWGNRYAGLGLHLIIAHAYGFETRYGHLSALTVITNTNVTRGQIIGTSGNTGNSTGPHLHFEVRMNGTPTDPFGGAGADWLWQDGSWQAGQWVGQPEPNYGTPLVVDDGDPYFIKGRGGIGGVSCPPESCPHWYPVSTAGWAGDMLYTYIIDTTPDYWARWYPPHAGLYDVQVWIPDSNATTWEARYWLVSSYNYMPFAYMVVDQWGTSNRWVSLGVYQFGYWPQAPWGDFWISDGKVHPNEHMRKLGVDAMRFRSPWPVYIPLVLKNY